MVSALNVDEPSYAELVGRRYYVWRRDDDNPWQTDVEQKWILDSDYYGSENYLIFTKYSSGWTVDDANLSPRSTCIYRRHSHDNAVLYHIQHPLVPVVDVDRSLTSSDKVLVNASKYPNVLTTFHSMTESWNQSIVRLIPYIDYTMFGPAIHPLLSDCYVLGRDDDH